MNSISASHAEEAINHISGPVGARIDALLVAEINRWAQLHPSLTQPLESLRSLVTVGGKRLRPAFCYWAFIGAGGDPFDPLVIDAGAALELLHSFALIHDDVMDDSRQRRGNDAVHVQFEQLHSEKHWRGEARRFGEGAAILVGDMAFVYADHLMAGAPKAAHDVFNEMRVELNIGQYLDVAASASNDASLEMAQKIAQYKSGKYTVERPMHLGAALAGKFEELASSFSSFGIPIGEAFQLRDDLLGAFGDATLTGKPVGGDIREGKPTALLATAAKRAEGIDAKLLESRYGAADLTEQEVSDLQEVLERTGAKKSVENAIENLVDAGLATLANTDIDSQAKEMLRHLGYFVAGRSH